MSFRCDADNIVMQNELEKPLSNFLYLTVMCKLPLLFFVIFWNSFHAEILSIFTNNLNVLADPPVVTVSPANLLVTENGDVYLDCRYDSNPSSLKRVTW